ncbi:Mbeg1-like protein [Butyrivibrio sp. XB500-5]|uniref:Mbeg1-like protein n=1 Tax=Butyrivibrio sp. XB500-5 TaxID=2364880 RepID=UPI0013141A29|nr:Mbeg1-like protein [Butyrivibrio sp. XB500-5]
MANVINYIKWRGDLTFGRAPFNEVDNLALSLLVYNDFTGIIPGKDEEGSVTVKKASEEFIKTYSLEGAPKTDFGWVPYYMRNSKRFGELRLSDYLDIKDTERDMMITAFTVHFPSGAVFVVFRGTTMEIDDWRMDFQISFEEIKAQKAAVKYLNHILNKYAGDVYVGGHSKGGNLALYAAMHISDDVQDRIKHIYSNDGPGFCPELIDMKKFEDIKWKLTHIVPTYSIVGMLFELPVPHKIVASDATKLLQHSGMTWQVEGDHFVIRLHLTEESSGLNRVIDDWIGNATMEQRKSFTKDMFDSMKSGGAVSLEDISKSGIHDFGTIILSAAGSESKTKILLGKFFGSLWREFEKIRILEALKTQQGIIDVFLILLGIIFLATPQAVYNVIGGGVAISCAIWSATRLIKAGLREEKAYIKRGRMVFHIFVLSFMVFILSNIERIPKWTNALVSIIFFYLAIASVFYIVKHKDTIKKGGIFWMITIAVINLNLGIITLFMPQRLNYGKSITVGSYLILIGIVRLVIQILTKKGLPERPVNPYENEV